MTSKLFNISCNSSSEILTKLLSHISKSGYKLCTLSQSATDVRNVQLITIELEIEGRSVDCFIHEVTNMDGVLDATVSFGATLQMATYQIKTDTDILKTLDIIRLHNTQVIAFEVDKLLIVHIASERDIRLLYNKLDTNSLLGFCQMPLAIGQSLAWDHIV